MKVLFIGGTGNISTAVSRLAVERGFELFLLNRGRRKTEIPGAQTLVADIHKPAEVASALAGHRFDCVVNWIAYVPDDIERDIELFRSRTGQYIFISSASAYQKPLSHPIITESTPLHNPYWEYSRNKITCEERLMSAYRQSDFPVTIVRPSHTYDRIFPVAIGGADCYTLADRMERGKRVVIHGDGTSLWTLTHSEDFAKGFVGLLGHPKAVGQSFHITSDELLTWDQIYHSLGAALGVEPNIVHISSDLIARINPEIGAGLLGDKAWSVIFDNSKIKTLVPDYVATIPFYRGIRRTLAWFNEEPGRKWINETVNREIDQILAIYDRRIS
jgi:nucleoside-diphosphate-sugar epimerase